MKRLPHELKNVKADTRNKIMQTVGNWVTAYKTGHEGNIKKVESQFARELQKAVINKTMTSADAQRLVAEVGKVFIRGMDTLEANRNNVKRILGDISPAKHIMDLHNQYGDQFKESGS